jgi:hypothetical protein
MTINSETVERHSSILDAPDEVIRCWAWGHRWDPGPVTERQDYGTIVWFVVARCDCGRHRSETLSPKTANLLTRDYGGGHGLMARVPVERTEARAEWARRARARAAGVTDVGSKRRARRKRGA